MEKNAIKGEKTRQISDDDVFKTNNYKVVNFIVTIAIASIGRMTLAVGGTDGGPRAYPTITVTVITPSFRATRTPYLFVFKLLAAVSCRVGCAWIGVRVLIRTPYARKAPL